MPLRIHNLSKSFDGQPVLSGVSTVLEEGNTYCLMGPSGAGKTTLLRILMGLERADSGRVEGLSGLRISTVFQEDRLCEGFTALENVRLAAAPSLSDADIRKALSAILPPQALDRPVSALSGGMKRRTAIGRALLAPFDLLLMDEPFTGLDEDTRRRTAAFIRERAAGRMILLSTHQEEDVRLFQARVLNFWQQP